MDPRARRLYRGLAHSDPTGQAAGMGEALTGKRAGEGAGSFACDAPAAILGAMEGGGLDQDGAMPQRGTDPQPAQPSPETPGGSGDHVFNPSALEDLGVSTEVVGMSDLRQVGKPAW